MRINKILLNKIENLEKSNNEILSKLNQQGCKINNNFNEPLVTVGPRVQKINPETLELVQVYETVSVCMSESNFKIKRPTLNKAIAENTVYLGFRWAFVDRNMDSSIIHNLNQTKVTKIQNLGYIAKLNSDKTKIIDVYLNRKTACKLNGYQSLSALDIAVLKNKLSNGFYYILYDKCDDVVKSAFNNGKEVVLYKNGIGQFDDNGQLLQEFICKYDCIKQIHVSDKTLTKCLNKNIKYNDFYFKLLGDKLNYNHP